MTNKEGFLGLWRIFRIIFSWTSLETKGAMLLEFQQEIEQKLSSMDGLPNDDSNGD